MNRARTGLVVALALLAMAACAQEPELAWTNQPVANGSFESNALAPKEYRYGRDFGSTTTTWQATGSAGMARNGSGFNNPDAPDGVQVGLIQGEGGLRLNLRGLQPGREYRLSLCDAMREYEPAATQDAYEVLIDGRVIGGRAMGKGDKAFTRRVVGVFRAPRAAPMLEIRSEDFDGDETTFFDDVRLEYQPAWPTTVVLTY